VVRPQPGQLVDLGHECGCRAIAESAVQLGNFFRAVAAGLGREATTDVSPMPASTAGWPAVDAISPFAPCRLGEAEVERVVAAAGEVL